MGVRDEPIHRSHLSESSRDMLNKPDDTVIYCGVSVTNRLILKVSFCSFLAFVIAEIIGALASNSLSLLGDAAAMSVDVFSVRQIYNLYHAHVVMCLHTNFYYNSMPVICTC